MSDQYRLVWLSEDDAIGAGDPVRAKWDAAAEDAWSEIADEFKRHRCKDGDCFAESVFMRLGAISGANPLSPFGF